MNLRRFGFVLNQRCYNNSLRSLICVQPVLLYSHIREVWCHLCVPCRWVWCCGGAWWPGPMTAQTAVHWVCIQIHAHSKGRQEGEHRGWGPKRRLDSYGWSEQYDQSLSRAPFRTPGYFKQSEWIMQSIIMAFLFMAPGARHTIT